jgi:hypothetical protein
METKEKLIEVFKKLIENSKIEDLDRERQVITVYDLQTKCKKRMHSLMKFLPTEIGCGINFSCDRSYVDF